MDVLSIGQAGIYSLSMRDAIYNFVTYLAFSVRQSWETLVNTMLKETPSSLKYNKKNSQQSFGPTKSSLQNIEI